VNWFSRKNQFLFRLGFFHLFAYV
jgi:hypothetical protein